MPGQVKSPLFIPDWGEIDQAFEWLDRAVEPDELDDLRLSWSDVEYDPLRDDPRFQDLLLRMNLVP